MARFSENSKTYLPPNSRGSVHKWPRSSVKHLGGSQPWPSAPSLGSPSTMRRHRLLLPTPAADASCLTHSTTSVLGKLVVQSATVSLRRSLPFALFRKRASRLSRRVRATAWCAKGRLYSWNIRVAFLPCWHTYPRSACLIPFGHLSIPIHPESYSRPASLRLVGKQLLQPLNRQVPFAACTFGSGPTHIRLPVSVAFFPIRSLRTRQF